jgi:hypothetical protein
MKRKARLLADAAIAGERVRKLTAKRIAAPDEDVACETTFVKANLNATLGVCVVAVSSVSPSSVGL